MKLGKFAPAVLLLCATASPAALAGPALVFDPQTDAVLYAEDADVVWHPASLTKMMTAYLAFEAIKAGKLTMESTLVCSAVANAQPASKIGLPVGGEMSLEVGLKALLIKSANDVAVMIGEAVAGDVSSFVKRMNDTARRLGMSRTHFNNPNGLPDAGQVTTARDMAYLARAILRDYPEFTYMFALPSMQIGKIRLRNYNSLLKTFDGADGMKTGFICDSGYNVVASATRDGQKLVAVVLGEASDPARDARAADLLDQGFRRYFWKSMFGARLDNMAMDESLSGEPKSLRGEICRPRPAKRTRKPTRASAAGSSKSN